MAVEHFLVKTYAFVNCHALSNDVVVGLDSPCPKWVKERQNNRRLYNRQQVTNTHWATFQWNLEKRTIEVSE